SHNLFRISNVVLRKRTAADTLLLRRDIKRQCSEDDGRDENESIHETEIADSFFGVRRLVGAFSHVRAAGQSGDRSPHSKLGHYFCCALCCIHCSAMAKQICAEGRMSLTSGCGRAPVSSDRTNSSTS